jgi:hypothetical protein
VNGYGGPFALPAGNEMITMSGELSLRERKYLLGKLENEVERSAHFLRRNPAVNNCTDLPVIDYIDTSLPDEPAVSVEVTGRGEFFGEFPVILVGSEGHTSLEIPKGCSVRAIHAHNESDHSQIHLHAVCESATSTVALIKKASEASGMYGP